MTPPTPHHRGFTLIEILAVIAVIAILVAMTIPLTTGATDSRRVSAEADSLTSQIAYAQLLAASSGQPVEVRYYLQPITETDDTSYVRGSQIMVTNTEGIFQPDGRIRKLEGKVIIHPSAEFSSIIGGEPNPPDPNASDVGNGLAEELEYHALRILPSGATTLGQGGTMNHWTLTLVNWNPVMSETELPDDFVTLQVDPFTTKLRRYEPGH